MRTIADRLTALHRNPNRACNGMDTELFFPEHGAYDNGQIALAKRTCYSCPRPLRTECLQVALAAGPSHQWGIWGGYTGRQRQAILRRREEVA